MSGGVAVAWDPGPGTRWSDTRGARTACLLASVLPSSILQWVDLRVSTFFQLRNVQGNDLLRVLSKSGWLVGAALWERTFWNNFLFNFHLYGVLLLNYIIS